MEIYLEKKIKEINTPKTDGGATIEIYFASF